MDFGTEEGGGDEWSLDGQKGDEVIETGGAGGGLGSGVDVWRSRPGGSQEGVRDRLGQGRDVDFGGIFLQRPRDGIRCSGGGERKRLGGCFVQLFAPIGTQMFSLSLPFLM